MNVRIPIYALQTMCQAADAIGASHSDLLGEAVSTARLHAIEKHGPLCREATVKHGVGRPILAEPTKQVILNGIDGKTKRALAAAAVRMNTTQARLVRACVDHRLGEMLATHV